MVWIRMQCRQSTVMTNELATVRGLLLDIEECGRLMPGVQLLEARGNGVYHYVLEAFSNGAVSMTPDYETRFDPSDPSDIRWEPHGEHNFRSWGSFRTTDTPVAGEVLLEIDTHAEADVAIDRILIPLIEPFARRFTEEVTAGFLAAIKQTVEAAPAGAPPLPGVPPTAAGAVPWSGPR